MDRYAPSSTGGDAAASHHHNLYYQQINTAGYAQHPQQSAPIVLGGSQPPTLGAPTMDGACYNPSQQPPYTLPISPYNGCYPQQASLGTYVASGMQQQLGEQGSSASHYHPNLDTVAGLPTNVPPSYKSSNAPYTQVGLMPTPKTEEPPTSQQIHIPAVAAPNAHGTARISQPAPSTGFRALPPTVKKSEPVQQPKAPKVPNDPPRPTVPIPRLPPATYASNPAIAVSSREQDVNATIDETFGPLVERVFVPSSLPAHTVALIDCVAMHIMVGGPLVAAEVQHRERNNPHFAFMMPPPPPPPFESTDTPESHWRASVSTVLSSPEVVYYRWRLYSLLNGDTLLSWRTQPFVMEATANRERGDRERDRDRDRGERRSPPATRPNSRTLVWVPPPMIAPAGAASVHVPPHVFVPLSCMYSKAERGQIKRQLAEDRTAYDNLFSRTEDTRQRKLHTYLQLCRTEPTLWRYPREEPWKDAYTGNTGWMTRQACQQHVPHVYVSSFTITSSMSNADGRVGRASVLDSAIEEDSAEVAILGGDRSQALGQANYPDEVRTVAKLPALLSEKDASEWRSLLDTKSMIKRACLRLSQQGQALSSDGGTLPMSRTHEWTHVVDQFRFLLLDGEGSNQQGSSSQADEATIEPAQLDRRDLAFIEGVLHPALLDRNTVVGPRTLWALQHHQAPLNVMGIILDEVTSLAHLPFDLFLAIDAGMRELAQERGTTDTKQTLSVVDLQRLKRRIVLVHLFATQFCLFLVHDILTSVQTYGGSAVLSLAWKQSRRMRRKHANATEPESDGSGSDDDTGASTIASCVGLPSHNSAAPTTTNTTTTSTSQPRNAAMGSKRAREGVEIVPSMHLAGMIRGIEMVAAAVIEAVLMLVQSSTTLRKCDDAIDKAALSTQLAAIQAPQTPTLATYAGVLLHWLTAFVGGWFGDGAVLLSSPSPQQQEGGGSVPPTLSLHPLTSLTQRFALDKKAPPTAVRQLSATLLNHPAIKVLLLAQRRRLALVDKYGFLF